MRAAVFALLLSAAAFAVAAPVPPPSEREKIAKQWGKTVAPSDGYQFKLDGRNLTIRTNGEPTDQRSVCNHSMHPRVTKTVTGDFQITVRVVSAALPDLNARYPQDWPASRAGLFAAGGEHYAELELLQYFVLDRGVLKKETPNRVVWVNTQAKTGFQGRHIAHLEPLKPLYLRIVREGKTVSDYYSADGHEWTPTNWKRGLELPDEVTVGVYFAHTTHQVAEAMFSDFTIEKLPAPK
jgi:hypothetical protein